MSILLDPFYQAVDANGLPLAGAKLYFYLAGTSTPVTIYQDYAATTPHTNPVIAASNGAFPPIYLTDGTAIKTILKTSADVTVQTVEELAPSRIFLSNAFRILDSTDQTKRLAFNLSGITSGQTRTITVPDVDGTMLVTGIMVLSAAQQGQSRANIGAALKGHLTGLTLSNNTTDATNDIDISAGEAASEQASPLLMVFAGATGVQLDVAYGTGSGGRFDSAISNGTWHVFIISNGTTVGRGLSKSLNPTAEPNWPSGYTHYRRIGSILRVSSAIVAFTQVGDEFLRTVVNLDVSAPGPGTAAFSQVLAVPTGIQVVAKVIAGLSNSGTGVVSTLYASSLDQTDQAPSVTVAPLAQIMNVINGAGGVANAAATFPMRTNTSGQIRVRLGSSDASVTVSIATAGWFDTRGR